MVSPGQFQNRQHCSLKRKQTKKQKNPNKKMRKKSLIKANKAGKIVLKTSVKIIE